VANELNLPAYVIFHDATLVAIAQRAPQSLDDLQGITGIGAKKLKANRQEYCGTGQVPYWPLALVQ
jgi:ATP-dependent DNA helicase RecQ